MNKIMALGKWASFSEIAKTYRRIKGVKTSTAWLRTLFYIILPIAPSAVKCGDNEKWTNNVVITVVIKCNNYTKYCIWRCGKNFYPNTYLLKIFTVVPVRGRATRKRVANHNEWTDTSKHVDRNESPVLNYLGKKKTKKLDFVI